MREPVSCVAGHVVDVDGYLSEADEDTERAGLEANR
jgi:hypothetical protein